MTICDHCGEPLENLSIKSEHFFLLFSSCDPPLRILSGLLNYKSPPIDLCEKCTEICWDRFLLWLNGFKGTYWNERKTP